MQIIIEFPYRPPKRSCRSPKSSYRPPKSSRTPPKNSCGPPKRSYRPPKGEIFRISVTVLELQMTVNNETENYIRTTYFCTLSQSK